MYQAFVRLVRYARLATDVYNQDHPGKEVPWEWVEELLHKEFLKKVPPPLTATFFDATTPSL